VTTPRSIFDRQLLPVTVSVLSVVSLAAFDGLSVTAALPSIAEDLGDVGLLPWVITAYLIVSSVAIIVAGPFIDGLGVRRTFRITVSTFFVASALCAVAPTLPLLVAARALQGLGGGMVVAIGVAAVGVAYPVELRPKAFAANSTVWGVMGVGGPALAAGLVTTVGWRGIFLVNLPLAAAAMAFGWRGLPDRTEHQRLERFDATGVAILAALTFIVLLGLSTLSVWSLASVVAFVALAAAYWRHSGRIATPVLRREHITTPPYWALHVTAGFVLAAALGVDNYLPLYVRGSLGYSEGFAAFSVLYLTIGWTIAAWITSRLLERRTEPPIVLAGALLVAVGLTGAGLLVVAEAPVVVLFAVFGLVGLGVGTVTTASLNLMQKVTDTSAMGRVSSAHQFLRSLGITYGAALAGGVILLVVGQRLDGVDRVRDALSGDEVAFDAGAADAIASGFSWAHLVGVGLALVAVAAATRLRQGERADRAQARPGTGAGRPTTKP
jgi:MFS family permease